jgi:uncharacterized protein YfbU (UPF0304 family)
VVPNGTFTRHSVVGLNTGCGQTGGKSIDLSIVERGIIWNQLELLKAASPKRARDYSESQTILECGYRMHYKTVLNHINENEFSEEDSQFVYDVLDLYDAISRAPERGLTGTADLQFRGFDGNSETVSFAIFSVQTQGKWDYLVLKYLTRTCP